MHTADAAYENAVTSLLQCDYYLKILKNGQFSGIIKPAPDITEQQSVSNSTCKTRLMSVNWLHELLLYRKSVVVVLFSARRLIPITSSPYILSNLSHQLSPSSVNRQSREPSRSEAGLPDSASSGRAVSNSTAQERSLRSESRTKSTGDADIPAAGGGSSGASSGEFGMDAQIISMISAARDYYSRVALLLVAVYPEAKPTPAEPSGVLCPGNCMSQNIYLSVPLKW